MTKNLIALLLLITITISIFAGCRSKNVIPSSASDSSTVDESSDTAGDPPPADDGEPIILQLQTHHLEKLNKDQFIFKELEKKFNVKFEMYQTQEKEAINLRIISGDIPDVVRDFSFIDYHSYIDQGILAELPVELLKEHSPRLVDWFEKFNGPEGWKYYEYEGKSYSIPIQWTLAVNANVVGYREDFLNEIGLPVPTTLEEVEEVLLAFKEKRTTAPYTGTGLGSFSSIYGAYGIYQTYYEKDGKIVYGGIEDGAKEAVTLLNKWYSKGLIDPEFMINKHDNIVEKWSNDEALVTQATWYQFLPANAFFDGSLYEPNKEKEGFSNIVVLPPKGANGEFGLTEGHPIPSSGLQFGKHLEEDQAKLIKYLQVFDYSMDREMSDFLYYGIEGETYNYNDTTGVEWIVPYDDEEKRNEFGINLYTLPGSFNDYDLQAKYMTQPRYLELRNEAESKGVGVYNPLSPIYRPIFEEKNEILDKIYTNAHIDFITGTKPLDEWDAFVEEWLASGGQEVLNEAQEAFATLK